MELKDQCNANARGENLDPRDGQTPTPTTAATPAGNPTVDSERWVFGQKVGTTLTDPYKTIGVDGEGEGQGLKRARLDLDGDDVKDLILIPLSTLGQNGGNAYLYLAKPAGFIYVGGASLDPKCLKTTKETKTTYKVLKGFIRHAGTFNLAFDGTEYRSADFNKKGTCQKTDLVWEEALDLQSWQKEPLTAAKSP